MKVLIIEDEKPAAEKLSLFLQKYDTSIEIVAVLTSVSESVKYLSDNQQTIDLIFLDIQLNDGISFEIFKKIKVETPIIFTTAYNEYALNAFEVNSIDYLLKPLSYEALERSMKKIENLKEVLPGSNSVSNNVDYNALAAAMLSSQKSYKNRFMVKVRDHIKSIEVNDITVFYAEGRDVFLQTNENRKYIIDFKLEELVDILDPEIFYRVNRTFIVNIKHITDVIAYSNSRLRINTSPNTEKEIIVSREKVSAFKDWFGG